MKIVSLLPSATEIVFALGLGDDLAAVTEECDWPPEVDDKPIVSRSALPPGLATSREIDEAVRDRMDVREPIYRLDVDLIRRIEPDVILTQDLCRVCAVPSGQVERALEEIGATQAQVLSLDPHSLDQVIESIRSTGRLLGATERAEELASSLRDRLAAVGRITTGLPSIGTFALEWLDPAFVAGHWVPEMVQLAGGTNLLNEPEAPSRVVTWERDRTGGPRGRGVHAVRLRPRRRRDRGGGPARAPDAPAAPRGEDPQRVRGRRDVVLLAPGTAARRRRRGACLGAAPRRVPGAARRAHRPARRSGSGILARVKAQNLVTPSDVGRRVSFQFELPNGFVGEAVGVLEYYDAAAETYMVRRKNGELARVPARGVRFGKVVEAEPR